MAKKNFFHREIKEDGVGLYVHYGSIRLRPLGVKQITNFTKGQIVSMEVNAGDMYYGDTARVFMNTDWYEVWVQPTKQKYAKKQ